MSINSGIAFVTQISILFIRILVDRKYMTTLLIYPKYVSCHAHILITAALADVDALFYALHIQ
jgi:hypothetical protein